MDARTHINSHAREFIDDLKQWLAIPSISADPEHHDDVRRSAEWLASHLKTLGFPGREVRGHAAADDKGQVLFHSLGIRACLAVSRAEQPPVTIKLIVEGEEESGSEHFAALLERERDRLACAVIGGRDTSMWAADAPSMCT